MTNYCNNVIIIIVRYHLIDASHQGYHRLEPLGVLLNKGAKEQPGIEQKDTVLEYYLTYSNSVKSWCIHCIPIMR